MWGPDFLFQLSPRDQQSLFIESRSRSQTVALAATTVDVPVFTVPDDRILVLFSAVASGTPGAGQAIDNLQIFLQGASGVFTTIGHTSREAVAPAGRQLVLVYTGQMWVPSGSIITMRGTFDAGVAANSVAANFFGFLIPRGSIGAI